MSSRIEEIIQEIEDYVDTCKFQPLSSTKIVVNKEELEELLRELRMKTPDEIKRYQKIISNKDAILDDARGKAETIIAEAEAKADRIVSESEVMRKALEQSNELLDQTNVQAQEMVDKAASDANEIRLNAIDYTDEMLANLEQIMAQTLETAGQKYKEFLDSIQACYDVVSSNRAELSPQPVAAGYAMPKEEPSASEKTES